MEESKLVETLGRKCRTIESVLCIVDSDFATDSILEEEKHRCVMEIHCISDVRVLLLFGSFPFARVSHPRPFLPSSYANTA